jgi:integrase
MKEKSFLEVMKDWIEYSKNDIQPDKGNRRVKSTIQTYEGTYKALEKFQNQCSYKLSFQGMNKDFCNAFYKFVVTEHIKGKKLYEDQKKQIIKKRINTLSKYFVKLKTFLNWAIEQDYPVNPKYKFIRINPKYDKPHFLSKEQLKKLHDLDLEDHKSEILSLFKGSRYKGDKYAIESFQRVKYVKDLFLFMCYTSLGYSDLMSLKPNHIKGNFIIFPDSCISDCELVIPLHDDEYIKPKEIISKYAKNGFERIFKFISNAEMNRDLKIIQKFIEIDFPLTTKIGRKTFINHMFYERNLSKDLIIESTGHKKLQSCSNNIGRNINELLKKHRESSTYFQR